MRDAGQRLATLRPHALSDQDVSLDAFLGTGPYVDPAPRKLDAESKAGRRDRVRGFLIPAAREGHGLALLSMRRTGAHDRL